MWCGCNYLKGVDRSKKIFLISFQCVLWFKMPLQLFNYTSGSPLQYVEYSYVFNAKDDYSLPFENGLYVLVELNREVDCVDLPDTLVPASNTTYPSILLYEGSKCGKDDFQEQPFPAVYD